LNGSGTAILAVLVLVVAVAGYLIWDRRRYRGGGPGDFKRTDEVFRDPTTGRLTRVWEDPSTGRRDYRDEPEGPGAR
jgi:hypothetical protein